MNMSDIIKRLEDAIQVCYNAESNNDKGYPYATGYSMVIMQNCVRDLKGIMNEKD